MKPIRRLPIRRLFVPGRFLGIVFRYGYHFDIDAHGLIVSFANGAYLHVLWTNEDETEGGWFDWWPMRYQKHMSPRAPMAWYPDEQDIHVRFVDLVERFAPPRPAGDAWQDPRALIEHEKAVLAIVRSLEPLVRMIERPAFESASWTGRRRFLRRIRRPHIVMLPGRAGPSDQGSYSYRPGWHRRLLRRVAEAWDRIDPFSPVEA